MFSFRRGSGCVLLFVVDGVGGRNSVVACWRASLMVLSICL